MSNTLKTGNKILFYTLITLIILTVFMIINSYLTQLSIIQEKELFKLECVASALTFNIDGDEHEGLFNKYPGKEFAESASMDSLYMVLSNRMGMAKNINGINSEIYTLVYDSLSNRFLFGISSSENPIWMDYWTRFPTDVLDKYETGGTVNEPYEDENGTWLSAFKPIKNSKGEVKAILQVDEKFDVFIMKARREIYMNIGISLLFIVAIGILMYFSVRSIVKRQEKVRLEKLQVENMRKDLLANISHDLRTPLSSIYGYLETIQMKKNTLSEERINKYLNTSLKNTEKLKNLVDELFELSILESRGKELNFEACNVNDLIHDVMNELKLKSSEKGIKIKTDLDENAPNVRADIASMDRVLQNLLSNAIKFCKKGDEVCITTKLENESVTIIVEDTGIGINESDLEFIFDRFSMGKSGETGTGLGLAIVKNILDLHDSVYKIESELNKGTKFTFSLKKF